MYLKKGDTVTVMSGKDKGKEGVIEKVLPNGRVVIENINMSTKHVKPNQFSSEGGRIEIEMSIDSSNVMLLDPEDKKPTRVGFKVEDGKKIRYSKRSGKEI